MMIVPLKALPNQRASVVLSGQPCTIDVVQRSTGLFLTLAVNSALVVANVICQDRNRLVRDAYLGFIGDLAFYDATATPPYLDGADPTYGGIGTQFFLVYLEPADLAR